MVADRPLVRGGAGGQWATGEPGADGVGALGDEGLDRRVVATPRAPAHAPLLRASPLGGELRVALAEARRPAADLRHPGVCTEPAGAIPPGRLQLVGLTLAGRRQRPRARSEQQ